MGFHFFQELFIPIYQIVTLAHGRLTINRYIKKLIIFAVTMPTFLLAVDCLPKAGEVGLGYDFFRSIPDGDWDGNTGAFGSINLGIPINYCDLGLQVGGSYGLYDWSGRGAVAEDSVQQQLFLTGGFYKRTSCSSGFNAGVVFDWMWNKRFGVFGVDTNFSQLRGQIGYQYCCDNEYGIWGTVDLGESKVDFEGIDLKFRSLSQVNAFWKHSFKCGRETMIWAGIPYKRSLAFDTGRAGKFIVGASFRAPLSRCLLIEGYGSYLVPHSSDGFKKQAYYGANICLEIKYFFGGSCVRNAPLLSTGNNSNFIADTNTVF